MKDVHENKLFYRTIQILYGVLIVCSMEVFSPLNDLLQLTPLPNSTDRHYVDDHSSTGNHNHPTNRWLPLLLDRLIEEIGFSGFMTITMLLDTILAVTLERTIRRIYTKTTQ